MRRSSIFLGDAAAALEALEPGDAETEQRIFDLLDLPTVEPARVHDEPAATETARDTASVADVEPPPDPNALPSYRYVPSSLESESPRVGSTPSLRPLDGAPPLALESSERDEPRLPLTPLTRVASTRAILSASLSTDVAVGVDVQRAVGIIARREPFDHLPVRTIRTVRRGVQLLVDKSVGMAPYLRDQSWLSEWIIRVVGRQRVEIASFTGVPQRGLHRGLRRLRAYRPPPSGTPIVVLTDLGIAYPLLDNAAGPADWLAFASLARHAGCPVTAFVPYPSARWPPGLDRIMTILQWDRQLTARQAAKRVFGRR